MSENMDRGSLGGRLYRGETSIDFVGRRKQWYLVSLALFIISIGAFFIQGMKLGIEFSGGTVLTVTSDQASASNARETVSSLPFIEGLIVQELGTDKVQIRTESLEPDELAQVEQALSSRYAISIETIDVQSIGPSWGEEITRKGITGLVAFFIIVTLYLAMTFEPKMAIAAFVALFHDVFITVGIYALIGFEVTPATLIGFLTILAYSLYDTVVVFDKVRENTKNITQVARLTYSQAANLAVNQTLIRSINTSIVAVLPIASLLFVGAGLLGAGTLKDVALVLFVGMIIGTFSSLFIATPVLAGLKEREPAMVALAKRVNSRGSNDDSSSATVQRKQPKRDKRR
ncbi:MAG: protein translocase subunit SecF [Candidatus Nanopelagicaceae bacterium]